MVEYALLNQPHDDRVFKRGGHLARESPMGFGLVCDQAGAGLSVGREAEADLALLSGQLLDALQPDARLQKGSVFTTMLAS
ncbi:hypothetical protein D3C77_366630 [compost metagenome]